MTWVISSLEMTQVIHWARENKIAVNLLKTVEMVFCRPNISDDLLPSVMPDVRRVALECTSQAESYFFSACRRDRIHM